MLSKKRLFFLIAVFVFSFFFASGGKSSSRSRISIQWLGQSCFLIEADQTTFPPPVPLRRKSLDENSKLSSGKAKLARLHFSLLIDPYNKDVGYPVHPVKADAVFISHEHFDHNNASMAPGATVIRGLKNDGNSWASLQLDLAPGIKLSTVGTYHDGLQGRERGLNSVSIVDVFGLRIVHLGDLGHLLSREQRKAIGKVDILLVPVGGHYTIDGRQAQEVVRDLNPRVVIPMHYKTFYTSASLPIRSEAEFLKGIAWPVKKIQTSTLVVSKERLPKKTTVYLLEPLSTNPQQLL